jgi:hypothetical protein
MSIRKSYTVGTGDIIKPFCPDCRIWQAHRQACLPSCGGIPVRRRLIELTQTLPVLKMPILFHPGVCRGRPCSHQSWQMLARFLAPPGGGKVSRIRSPPTDDKAVGQVLCAWYTGGMSMVYPLKQVFGILSACGGLPGISSTCVSKSIPAKSATEIEGQTFKKLFRASKSAAFWDTSLTARMRMLFLRSRSDTCDWHALFDDPNESSKRGQRDHHVCSTNTTRMQVV